MVVITMMVVAVVGVMLIVTIKGHILRMTLQTKENGLQMLIFQTKSKLITG